MHQGRVTLLLPVVGTILGRYQEPRYLENWFAWFYPKFRNRNSQTQLETSEKIKFGDRANLGNKVTAKITNVYRAIGMTKGHL